MSRKIVIVGGSAAGITAAITSRRYYPDSEITLIRKEEEVLVPCGIPYIFGTLNSPEENLISNKVLSGNNVKLVVDEVTYIDRYSKTLNTSKGEKFGYDRMIMATGSLPLVPNLPGVELNNVFVVKKELEYMKKLLQTVNKARDIVIIGGGFIGLEFADECKKKGDLNVTVVELLPHCLLVACDEDICARVEDKLSERGVNIITGSKVTSITGEESVEYVELENGEKIKADLVIMGIGIKPNIELASNSGLIADKKKGIQVDDFMRTSDKNIFAAGDCTEKNCHLSGEPRIIGLASLATTQARIAGANLFGIRRKMSCAVGIFSTRFGDFAVGSAGITEKSAKEMGIEFVTGKSSAPDRHPGSIPGSQELTVKLVFERDTGLLVGGQAYGSGSVGELINFIGAIIQHEMRADEGCTFQIGTHPLLTASPIMYQIADAAQIAVGKIRNLR